MWRKYASKIMRSLRRLFNKPTPANFLQFSELFLRRVFRCASASETGAFKWRLLSSRGASGEDLKTYRGYFSAAQLRRVLRWKAPQSSELVKTRGASFLLRSLSLESAPVAFKDLPRLCFNFSLTVAFTLTVTLTLSSSLSFSLPISLSPPLFFVFPRSLLRSLSFESYVVTLT